MLFHAIISIDAMRLVKNTAANLFGVGLPAAAALLSIPVIVGDVGVQLFGFFSVQMAVLYFLGLADFGISRAIVLSSFEKVSTDAAHWVRPFRAGMYYTIRLSIAVSLIGLPVGGVIFWLGLGGDNCADVAVSFGVIFLCAGLMLLSLPPRAVLEVQDRFAMMNMIRGASGASLFLAPLIVFQFYANLTAAAISIAVMRVIFLILFLRASGSWPETRLTRIKSQSALTQNLQQYRRDLLARVGWIGLTNTASPLLGYLDRFVVGFLISAGAVGEYVIAQELASKVSLLTGAAVSAAMPRLTQGKVGNDSRRFGDLIRATVWLVLLLGCLPSIILIIGGETILRLWLRESFVASSVVPMQILAIGIGINSLSQINFSLLQIFGGERDGAVLQLVQVPVVIVLLIVLIHFYGIVGAAMAISARLFIDGLILRWMLVRRCTGSAPGITVNGLLIAGLLGIILATSAVP